MCSHRLAAWLARFELLATALGLNVALAGMIVMMASAYGILDVRVLWWCWPSMACMMSCLTAQRLGRLLAPLFWCSVGFPQFPERIA